MSMTDWRQQALKREDPWAGPIPGDNPPTIRYRAQKMSREQLEDAFIEALERIEELEGKSETDCETCDTLKDERDEAIVERDRVKGKLQKLKTQLEEILTNS